MGFCFIASVSMFMPRLFVVDAAVTSVAVAVIFAACASDGAVAALSR